LQDVAPLPSWNMPGGQALQVALPPVLKLPAAHSMGWVAPAGQANPAGHALHSDADVPPVVLR